MLKCISSFGNTLDSVVSAEPTKREIIIYKSIIRTQGQERSLPGDVNAYIDLDDHTIEFELYGTMLTSIYIIDSQEAVVEQTIVDAESFQSVTFDLPTEKGNYHIVIDSPILYGEGAFAIM